MEINKLIGIVLIFVLMMTTVSATKVLPSNYSTKEYSTQLIKNAENSISIAEEKLTKMLLFALSFPNNK